MRSGGRALAALLAVPLLVVVAWVVHRGGTEREDPATVLAALRAAHGPMLPAADEVGASVRSRTESFDRKRLYEYIDGAAEAYLARGFERCVVADYTFPSDAAVTVEVAAEAYRFARPRGAAEQLAAERPRDARAVPGTDQAVSNGNVLLSLSDRDLLKLTVLTPAPGAADALERIARAWMKAS